MEYETTTRIPLVVFDEFLVVEEWQNLLRYTYERGNDFSATRVVGAGGNHHVDTSYRRLPSTFRAGRVS